MEWKAIFSMLGMLVLMAAVLFGAYWVSKQVGKGYQLQNTLPGKIEILGRSMIGKDQCLLLVKSAGKVFLLGATAQNITLISEVDPNELPATPSVPPATPDFLSVFKGVLKKGTSSNHKSDGGDVL